MDTLIWCTKIKPGKLDAWTQFNLELQGSKAQDAGQQRVRMGFRRHAVALQQLGDDDVVLNFVEAEDLKAGFRLLAESRDPFDLWFKERAFDIYGVTSEMLANAPSAQFVLDWP